MISILKFINEGMKKKWYVWRGQFLVITVASLQYSLAPFIQERKIWAEEAATRSENYANSNWPHKPHANNHKSINRLSEVYCTFRIRGDVGLSSRMPVGLRGSKTGSW